MILNSTSHSTFEAKTAEFLSFKDSRRADADNFVLSYSAPSTEKDIFTHYKHHPEMIPLGQCVVKPELKPGTHQMIGEIHTIQHEGSGSIPLKHFINTFGLPLTPEQDQLISKRGDIQFSVGNEAGGSFVNKGEKVKFSVDGVTIQIPQEISGKYDSSDDNVAFHFAPKKTLKVSKYFFSADLEKLKADKSRIDIDMSGDMFDTCIIFEPPAKKNFC